MITGAAIFVVIGFLLPIPESLVKIVKEYGFARTMMDWGIAGNVEEAAQKTMIVLGIIPMAVIFFATEAIPIGLTGILMPVLAYFLELLPKAMIGKTFAGDAPLFLLGVLAMGVVVVDVGFHKRLAGWILGWTKGWYVPIFAADGGHGTGIRTLGRLIVFFRPDDKLYVGRRHDGPARPHRHSHGHYDQSGGRALGIRLCCCICHLVRPFSHRGHAEQCHCIRPGRIPGYGRTGDQAHRFCKIWIPALGAQHGRDLGYRFYRNV